MLLKGHIKRVAIQPRVRCHLMKVLAVHPKHKTAPASHSGNEASAV